MQALMISARSWFILRLPDFASSINSVTARSAKYSISAGSTSSFLTVELLPGQAHTIALKAVGKGLFNPINPPAPSPGSPFKPPSFRATRKPRASSGLRYSYGSRGVLVRLGGIRCDLMTAGQGVCVLGKRVPRTHLKGFPAFAQRSGEVVSTGYHSAPRFSLPRTNCL